MSTVYNFAYQSSTGNIYYGEVATDPSSAYNYSAGQAIQKHGGTYFIGTQSYQSNVPAGTVYCTAYYDKSTDQTYDSYHYDKARDQYYNVSQNGYDRTTGTYQGVSLAAGHRGLGSEYDYARGPDNNYHVYGGGGLAHAQITPSTVGTHDYDYKFSYKDGSYYTGKVTDDGSFGYSAGYTKATPYGSYTITGIDAAPPSANEIAGYVTASTYYDASTRASYSSYNPPPGSQYYGKPNGYKGLKSEINYAQYPNGYHQYGGGGQYEASTSPPLAMVPPLT
jgi:hypothetical protein